MSHSLRQCVDAREAKRRSPLACSLSFSRRCRGRGEPLPRFPRWRAAARFAAPQQKEQQASAGCALRFAVRSECRTPKNALVSPFRQSAAARPLFLVSRSLTLPSILSSCSHGKSQTEAPEDASERQEEDEEDVVFVARVLAGWLARSCRHSEADLRGGRRR